MAGDFLSREVHDFPSETTMQPKESMKAKYTHLVRQDRVHGSLYHDPQVFADEMETIFHAGWVYIGHDSEVPVTSAFAAKPMGQQMLVMSRDAHGRVHVLFDRCPHRGNKILQADKGVTKSFVCPYHAWGFNLDGSFKGMPDLPGCGPDFQTSEAEMVALPRVETYQGFVFGSMRRDGISLMEHLGRGKDMIDQLVRMSPTGKIRLSAGWMKQRIRGNWKNLLENQVDGYHAPFVHGSLAIANRDWANERDRRDSSPTTTRDLGMGHSDVDYTATYYAKGGTLRWTGAIAESRVPEYVAAMRAAYGPEAAERQLVIGPPHAMIFPNLFIAEMNIMVLEPVNADECIYWTTPVLLEDGHEINERTIRRCEGALGPAGFLIADDTEISELNQIGIKNRDPEWVLLGRGLHDEEHKEDGTIVGGLMDETSQRAFWRHYGKLMVGA